MKKKKAWYVYIIECRGGRLYTGITTDVERRISAHKSGKGARFTRAFGVKRLLYTQRLPSQSKALSREARIKSLPRTQKLALIRKNDQKTAR